MCSQGDAPSVIPCQIEDYEGKDAAKGDNRGAGNTSIQCVIRRGSRAMWANPVTRRSGGGWYQMIGTVDTCSGSLGKMPGHRAAGFGNTSRPRPDGAAGSIRRAGSVDRPNHAGVLCEKLRHLLMMALSRFR